MSSSHSSARLVIVQRTTYVVAAKQSMFMLLNGMCLYFSGMLPLLWCLLCRVSFRTVPLWRQRPWKTMKVADRWRHWRSLRRPCGGVAELSPLGVDVACFLPAVCVCAPPARSCPESLGHARNRSVVPGIARSYPEWLYVARYSGIPCMRRMNAIIVSLTRATLVDVL